MLQPYSAFLRTVKSKRSLSKDFQPPLMCRLSGKSILILSTLTAQLQLLQRKTISLTICKSLQLQVGLKHLANFFH